MTALSLAINVLTNGSWLIMLLKLQHIKVIKKKPCKVYL